MGLICFSSPFDETAVDFLEDLGELDSGCTQLMLLKCTSTYPATPENTSIRTIPTCGSCLAASWLKRSEPGKH